MILEQKTALEFELAWLLDIWLKNKNYEIKIEWEGYPLTQATWESIANLNADSAINLLKELKA